MLNDGVLIQPRRDTDWIAGGQSGIVFEARNPSGDWRAYEPPKENQYSNNADSMACVSYSLCHCLETQEYFLTGKQVDYSERWLAKLSGTTPQGNYQTTVADTVRKYGLVKQESWPVPPNFTWITYYTDPTPEQYQALIAEGQEWLKTHQFAYEFVNAADVAHELQQAPLQVVITAENPYHAQELVRTDVIFDSYPPWDEPLNHTIYDYLKPLLTMKGESMNLINDNGTVFLVGRQGKLGIADGPALDLMKSIDGEVDNRSSGTVPQVGTLTHNDAFVIHK